jgi:hypothetical protein
MRGGVYEREYFLPGSRFGGRAGEIAAGFGCVFQIFSDFLVQFFDEEANDKRDVWDERIG